MVRRFATCFVSSERLDVGIGRHSSGDVRFGPDRYRRHVAPMGDDWLGHRRGVVGLGAKDERLSRRTRHLERATKGVDPKSTTTNHLGGADDQCCCCWVALVEPSENHCRRGEAKASGMTSWCGWKSWCDLGRQFGVRIRRYLECCFGAGLRVCALRLRHHAICLRREGAGR